MPDHPPINRSEVVTRASVREPSVSILCAAHGVIALLAAALWSVAGAGIYGSPFTGMQSDERTRVLAFITLGPVVACAASISALQWPRVGSIGLIIGGVASGLLALRFIRSDAGPFPLMLVSLPMIALGCWRLRLLSASPTTPLRPTSVVWTIVDIFLFGVTMYLMYQAFVVLWRLDIAGLSRSGRDRWDSPALVAIAVIAALTLLATVFRKRLGNVRWSILAGAWWAVMTAIVICAARIVA